MTPLSNQAEHQRDCYAAAINEFAVKVGLIAEGSYYEGPHLLLFLSEIGDAHLNLIEQLNEANEKLAKLG